MNERIRQFEKESGLEIYGLGARREKWEAALEKYAELIVRECVDVVKWTPSMFPNDAIIKNIKEHFGVEE